MRSEKKITERIEYIDFLKFIGITAIVLAHVSAPKWLTAIRSFDVPLMVIVSALLGEKSIRRYDSNNKTGFAYCVDRIKRLLIPTWIFLVLYFVFTFLVTGSLYNVECYIASFALTRYGIGYVWVILIYLYSAVQIPVFYKVGDSKIALFSIAFIYVGYEVLCCLNIGVDNKLMDTTFYSFIPYGVITYLGYHMRRYCKKTKLAIGIVSVCLCVGLGIYYWLFYGEPQSFGIMKYPARLYFLAYGVAIAVFLIVVCEKLKLKIYHNKIIRFVAGNSLWIYLWHILMLDVYKMLGLPGLWYMKLMFVYVTATGMVLLVNLVLDQIEKKKSYQFFKYLRG